MIALGVVAFVAWVLWLLWLTRDIHGLDQLGDADDAIADFTARLDEGGR